VSRIGDGEVVLLTEGRVPPEYGQGVRAGALGDDQSEDSEHDTAYRSPGLRGPVAVRLLKPGPLPPVTPPRPDAHTVRRAVPGRGGADAVALRSPPPVRLSSDLDRRRPPESVPEVARLAGTAGAGRRLPGRLPGTPGPRSSRRSLADVLRSRRVASYLNGGTWKQEIA
jgi:hypothetical protein